MRSNCIPGGGGDGSKRDGGKVVVKQSNGGVLPGDCIWAKLRGNLWWPAQVVDENNVSESNKPCKRAAGAVLVRLYGSYEYLYVDPTKSQSSFQIVLGQNNGSCREIFEKALEQHRSNLKSGSSKGKGSKSTGTHKSNRPIANEEVNCKYSEGGKHKKLKPNIPGPEEEAKGKTTKQDEVLKKMEQSDRNNEEDMSKISMQGKENEDAKNRTPEQDKKHKLNSPNSETSLSRKSCELNARRLRVMQSLALVAPSGSPFGKNGQIYLN